MKRLTAALAAVAVLAALPSFAVPAAAQEAPESSYDYWRYNRDVVWRGVQAILTCNGLFTSHRTVEQVYEQELAYGPPPVPREEVRIDREREAVAIGEPGGTPVMRAAFREGIGCVVMSPDQTFADISGLPEIEVPPPPGDPDTIAWPDGDLVEDRPLPAGVDSAALREAAEWAFERESPYQVTVSLLVVKDGQIVLERYAPGFDMDTRTRTWSTAKSLFVTVLGTLALDGRVDLDEPLGLDWLPELDSAAPDPRDEITLRNVLRMSSGLYPVDGQGLEYATGSGLAYWAGANSARGARDRGLVREPGTFWEYENYDTLLGVLKMKRVLGGGETYREYPHRALLDRIGMRSTLLSTDRFGNFIMSSQVYTNARDLARLGLLYLNGGTWNGERIISEEWIDFVRTPAPSTSDRGNFYGGQWWLPPDDRDDVPEGAYSTAGNRGQYMIVVPSHDVVIVRRGLDYGKQGFDNWSLTREVLKAIEPTSGGE